MKTIQKTKVKFYNEFSVDGDNDVRSNYKLLRNYFNFKLFANRNYQEIDITQPLCDPYETRPGDKPYTRQIIWFNVLIFIYLHTTAFYVLGLTDLQSPFTYWFSESTMCHTNIIFANSILIFQGFVYGYFGSLGTTAGAHRLWTHRSYKANLPLKAILLLAQTTSFQNSVFDWVRDHRVHHKYSDTNADPHNATRGFFFSHMGWLMCKKHPDVKKFGSKIDMSDLMSDRMLQFQHKFVRNRLIITFMSNVLNILIHRYYVILMLITAFVFPTWICTEFFREPFWVAFNMQILRNVISLHVTWSINSFAHFYGNKPFDK